ncbi:MAG: glutathione S-transferase family protein [Myxococcota bacterium]
MKLYFFPVAPNPTKVRLFLAEKEAGGASLEIEQVPVDLPKGEQRSPEHQARHPLGKVPVLELDDGSTLFESLAIIEYLEELYPEPPMLGRDALERARTREVERLADFGVLLPLAGIVHSTRSPLGWPPNPGAAGFFREQLRGPLRVLDDRLADGRPYLAGERPSVADCTLAAAFQFARFGQAEIDPALANLARWDTAYRQREPARKVLVL